MIEGLGATINVAKPKPGSSVAIFGLGAVGLAVCYLTCIFLKCSFELALIMEYINSCYRLNLRPLKEQGYPVQRGLLVLILFQADLKKVEYFLLQMHNNNV